MNISYNWLREYVDTTLSPQEVATALTSIGLEVGCLEEVQSIKGGLEGLWIAEVLTCEPHPNSDHMHVCQVNVGQGEPIQIVCGAPNVAAGQKVVVAVVGTVLYDGEEKFVIKKSKLRGIESHGMICSEVEIGIGTDHSGIIVLPCDAPVGTPAATYYNIESDYVIEVDITPNRADACSHYGVARDLYAWLVQNGYTTSLHRPSCEEFAIDDESLQIPVKVENYEACPRYCALTLTGCEVKESPAWLQDKLRLIGVRPINNIVDITNYIMMAYGQPLHCFDADMIEGGQVIVKTMPEGTPFKTLDGNERKLSEHDLTICNTQEPMCIAGVFGGKGSGTYETTQNVLLESAYFNPTWVRKSARRHGLSTDASFRFERGIDPNGQIYALKQAAILAKQLANAKVSMQIVDICPEPAADFPVHLEYNYVNELIGKVITPETVKQILTSLDVQIVGETGDALDLLVPAYRVDVKRPCDVVEEILRIYGYNQIEMPTSIKTCVSQVGEHDKSFHLQNIVSEQLVGAGFNEILNNSLQRGAYYEGLTEYPSTHSVQLINPLSNDLNALRQTLLFGGLESISRNISYRNTNLRLFEYGNTYFYDESRKAKEGAATTSKQVLSAYSEELHLGLWTTGKRISGTWAHPDEDTTFAELKAYVMNILYRTGVPMGMVQFVKGTNDIFSQSLSIQLRNGKVLAEMGIVSPTILSKMGIDTAVYFAEIRWQHLMKTIQKQTVTYREISKFPAVSRDLALLLDKNIEFGDIEKIAYQTEKKLLKSVSLFDVYEGKNLPAGKKSYAINFILQDESKTLTDKVIDAIMNKLKNNLTKELNAELR